MRVESPFLRDVEALLYHSAESNRYTQRSPIMPDVWIEYALAGPGPHDLLLLAHRESSAARLAEALAARLVAGIEPDQAEETLANARLVATPTVVAARLSFGQLLRAALPLSLWWDQYLYAASIPAGKPGDPQAYRVNEPSALFAGPCGAPGAREAFIDGLRGRLTGVASGTAPRHKLRSDALWLAEVAGTIAHLQALRSKGLRDEAVFAQWKLDRDLPGWNEVLVDALFAVLRDMAPAGAFDTAPPLWSIHRNRPAEMALYESTTTIKADAARHLFDVTGKGIRWAVVDTGIDATHVAFRRRDRQGRCLVLDAQSDRPFTAATRVRATYDFTHVRELMSLSPTRLRRDPEAVREALPAGLNERLADPAYREQLLDVLERSRSSHRSNPLPTSGGLAVVDWELWQPLLQVPHVNGRYRKPLCAHGTQVAGILAADWRPDDLADDVVVRGPDESVRRASRIGMCPEIELYDVRVLDENGCADEFSVLAALQFIHAINRRHEHVEIHGVNLSLSLLHDVANFACGRTPVCEECERLVAAGIVVVAAAGNYGRARYVMADGQVDEGYRTVSITDPGNAPSVITVGATHRFEPYTYGVSYFSSRGPTGDGRLKPDLVAPGEKIKSTGLDNSERSFDGTSAAAPHVSGAAALLLCRYAELIGRPAEVKRILCNTATDLGRDRYFQGAGLVDVLRAMESV